MEGLESSYWRGSAGQYNNPFRSKQPELGFIAPPNLNPLLLRI
jgi:hypothetical protein